MPMTEKTSRALRLADGVYEFRQVLKADLFASNELYERDGKGYVLKRSRFRIAGGILLWPLAMLISRHEYRMYQRVRDVPGVPPLGPRVGWTGYLHEYVPGSTLRATPKQGAVGDEFFPRLREIVEAFHRRRIVYLDLAKSENIIVGEDGRPYLIDFQVSVQFPPADTPLGRLLTPGFEFFRREDLYHFHKHKRKWRSDQMSAEEWARARRTGFGNFWWRWMSRPYLAVKRRIYPQGSDETIWWRWRATQAKEKKP